MYQSDGPIHHMALVPKRRERERLIHLSPQRTSTVSGIRDRKQQNHWIQESGGNYRGGRRTTRPKNLPFYPMSTIGPNFTSTQREKELCPSPSSPNSHPPTPQDPRSTTSSPTSHSRALLSKSPPLSTTTRPEEAEEEKMVGLCISSPRGVSGFCRRS